MSNALFVGRMPKYRRHKPSGQAVVTLSGRDHYLGPWKSKASRAEYGCDAIVRFDHPRCLPPTVQQASPRSIAVHNTTHFSHKRHFCHVAKLRQRMLTGSEISTGFAWLIQARYSD